MGLCFASYCVPSFSLPRRLFCYFPDSFRVRETPSGGRRSIFPRAQRVVAFPRAGRERYKGVKTAEISEKSRRVARFLGVSHTPLFANVTIRFALARTRARRGEEWYAENTAKKTFSKKSLSFLRPDRALLAFCCLVWPGSSPVKPAVLDPRYGPFFHVFRFSGWAIPT